MTESKSDERTLEEIWEQDVLPDMDDVAESTLKEYRQSIGIWKKLAARVEIVGGTEVRHLNPPANLIDRKMVKGFQSKLISTPYRRGNQKKVGKRSGATVNRIMRDLHVVVSPLWPADRKNPDGLGVIPFFKWPKSIAVQRKLPFVFRPEDLDQLYLKTGSARQPSKFARSTPMNEPRLWRLALVLGLNSAPRTWDLFGLTKDSVSLESDEQFTFGSLVFTAKKTGKLHRIPLNECAARHCEDILRRPPRGCASSDRLFPGFYKGMPFYKAWNRITADANVDATFESMRKTSVTRHNNVVWQAGLWLSGHVSPGVFGNYDNPSERIFEAVYKLEQPTQFIEGMKSLST